MTRLGRAMTMVSRWLRSWAHEPHGGPFDGLDLDRQVVTGAVTTTQQQQNLNEEARQAINRITRDIRQAR